MTVSIYLNLPVSVRFGVKWAESHILLTSSSPILVLFYDQSGVSTLESGFREDHCSEGPGPGFGKRSGAQFGAQLAK